MANRVTIEIEALLVDQVSGKTKYVISGLDGIGKAAKEAQKDLDKLGKKNVHPVIDVDNNKLLKKMRESDNKIAKFAGEKATAVLDVLDKGTSKINKMESGLKSITRKTWSTIVKIKDMITSPLKKIKNSLFSLQSLVITVTGVLAIKKTIMEPINIADAYSSTKIGFSTLLGDEKGQAMMDAMDDFAKKTPFKTSGVISNAQKMMAYGWDPERILEDMETIGDAAAATGKMDEGLEAIVYALSEIRSKGKLSTQELNQLAGAGIKAKRYLAEGLGYGSSDEGMTKLAKDLESGAIGANQAIDLILQGMQEFNGMMDRTANETVSGLKAQIVDAFEINIFRRWGQGLQDGAKRGMGSIVELLDSASEGLANLGDMLYEIGKKVSNWVADRLEGAVEMITALTRTEQFKNAGLGGKIKILWDGVVANPIKEWWEGGGREKTVATAGKVGAWLGKAITNGLLAIFGMTDILNDDKAKELGESGGMSVAQSFAKGFKDNFDGKAITDAFVKAINNIWKALPWWAKTLLIGKGLGMVGNLVGSIGNLVGGATKIFGSTGNYMVGGTGILGGLANIGYNAAGGAASAAGYFGAGMSGGKAALLGLGKVAGYGGLVVGGTTAISGGVDLYNGFKNDDATAKQAGAWKMGGALGGAGLGAAIGSIIPGIGTLVGAGIGSLIGSAVGHIGAGKVESDAEAERIAEAEAAAKKRERDIEKKINRAVRDGTLEDLAISESEAAEAAAKLLIQNEKLAKQSLDEHFGDVALSAEEMQLAIRNVIGEKFFEDTAAVVESIESMNASFAAAEAQSSSLKKKLWMATLKKDAELTNDEIAALKANADDFGKSAQNYVTDAQYAAEESITAILGNSEEAKKLIESNTEYYGKQGKELATLSEELNDAINKALSKDSDGGVVITVNEKKSIDNIRNKMAEITRRLQEEEYEIKINVLKAKYAGDLTAEDFSELMTGAAEQNKLLADVYWDGFGRASVGKSQEEIDILHKGVLDKLTSLWSNTGDLGLNTLREQYSSELGLLSKDIGTILKENTPEEIMSAVEGMDDGTRQAIAKLMESMKPTTDEVKRLVASYEELGLEVPDALTKYLDSAEFYEALGRGPDAVEKYFRDKEIDIDAKIEINSAVEASHLSGEIDDYFNSFKNHDAHLNVNWTYDEFDDEWISPDKELSFTTDALVDAGWTYDEFNGKWLSPDGEYWFTTKAGVDVDFDNNTFVADKARMGIKDTYSFMTTAMVRVKYKIMGGLTSLGNPKMSYASKQAELLYEQQYRGGIVGGSSALESFARGGMVRGGSKLIRVAEEGNPEMIIPLSSQRRNRALKLWAKAGEMMNVPGFARGGMTNRGADEGIRFHRYGADEGASGRTVQVDVGGITFEIHVNGTDAQSIAEAIKAQVADIAEDVAGVMAEAFSAQFENTPVRGGAA